MNSRSAAAGAYHRGVEPAVSVLIASDRVETLLPECLRSLDGQRGGPEFEAVVCSAQPPAVDGLAFPVRWIRADARNPARRRNAAAREARGSVLAFLDDDATAEPGWLAAGAAACAEADVVGGPDPGPRDAPYGERLANLLLATPGIGSGVPAHEWNPRGRAGAVGARRRAVQPLRAARAVRGAPGIRRVVRLHRRGHGLRPPGARRRSEGRPRPLRSRPAPPARVPRALPRAALALPRQDREVAHREARAPRARAGGHVSRGAFAASAGGALWGTGFLVPAAAGYALVAWALSFPLWRRDVALFPAVPFAFAVHHATYLAGLLAGIGRGVLGTAAR